MNAGCLVVTKGPEEGKRFLLKNLTVFEAGKTHGTHIYLKDDSVAYSHFRVYRKDLEYTVHDLGTTKGTILNGARIEKAVLSPGDVLQAGDVELRFEMADDSTPGRLASSAPDCQETDAQARCGGILTAGTARCRGLTVIEGKDKGRTYVLEGKERFVIGRALNADMKLSDGKISREHCQIEAMRDHHIIIDLESSNGTVVNGERVQKTVLKEGDYIRLGFTMIKYDMV